MKRNVLIIERNEAISFLLQTVLQKKFRTFRENNCLTATARLQKQNIDGIVLSIDGLKDDNYEFLSHIKTSYLFQSIPVLVVSNNKSPEFHRLLSSLGVSEVFQKPFDPLYIVERLNASIEELEVSYKSVSVSFGRPELAGLKVSI